MYRCDITGQLSLPGEKAYKIVVETRVKEYKRDNYIFATGIEIVKEITVCKEEYLRRINNTGEK